MQIQSNKLNFEGQKIFIGMDVHKKDWKVSIRSEERFHASGGVCPQTVLWEFGSLSPALTFVTPPPLRKVAAPVSSNLGDSVVVNREK